MISLTGFFFEMESLKDGVSRTVQIYDVSGIIHGVNFKGNTIDCFFFNRHPFACHESTLQKNL